MSHRKSVWVAGITWRGEVACGPLEVVVTPKQVSARPRPNGPIGEVLGCRSTFSRHEAGSLFHDTAEAALVALVARLENERDEALAAVGRIDERLRAAEAFEVPSPTPQADDCGPNEVLP